MAVDGWAVTYFGTARKGTGRGHSPPRPLLTIPNVTAHPSTASVTNFVLFDVTLYLPLESKGLKQQFELALTRTPDVIRLTRRPADPNRPTGWLPLGIFSRGCLRETFSTDCLRFHTRSYMRHHCVWSPATRHAVHDQRSFYRSASPALPSATAVVMRW